METKPRIPVLWLHGLECTCCTESFIRSAHPLAKDVVLSMISLDYDDTLMAAAGHDAEIIVDEIIENYKGRYILACEGNPPLNQDGMSCIIAGKPYLEQLKKAAEHCMAIISWGCVQAAKPNPTRAVPIHKVIHDKPIIKVPGCPPIPEVMAAVVRALKAEYCADMMLDDWNQLIANIKAGDINMDKWDPSTWPKEAKGWGRWPRPGAPWVTGSASGTGASTITSAWCPPPGTVRLATPRAISGPSRPVS